MTQYLSDISVEKAADFLAHRQVGARYVQLPPLSKAAEGPTFFQNLGQRFTDMSSPAKGALIGAIGGGGIGAASSFFRKDKGKHWMRDALTGMVAGGGAGLGAGAVYDKISPIKPPGGGDTPDTPDTPVTPGVPPLKYAPTKQTVETPEGRIFVDWQPDEQKKMIDQLTQRQRHNLWLEIKNEELSMSEYAHNIFGFGSEAMEAGADVAADMAIPDGGTGKSVLTGLAATSLVEPLISGGVNIRNKIKGQGKQWDMRPERLRSIEAATLGDKLPPAEAQLKQHVDNAKAKDTTGLLDRALRGEGTAAQELAQHMNTNPGSNISKAFEELMGHVDGLEKLETGALQLSTPRIDLSALEAMMARNRQAQGSPSGGTWFGKPRANMVPSPARGARNLWKKMPAGLKSRSYGALATALGGYALMGFGKKYTSPDVAKRQQALDAIPTYQPPK